MGDNEGVGNWRDLMLESEKVDARESEGVLRGSLTRDERPVKTGAGAGAGAGAGTGTGEDCEEGLEKAGTGTGAETGEDWEEELGKTGARF
jgi:hypothetical protein